MSCHSTNIFSKFFCESTNQSIRLGCDYQVLLLYFYTFLSLFMKPALYSTLFHISTDYCDYIFFHSNLILFFFLSKIVVFDIQNINHYVGVVLAVTQSYYLN